MASGTRAAEPLDRAATITVLVVDDEDEIRNLCRDVAAESGLRVRMAATTEQALEILDQIPVDIVLTDLRVPQLGGVELLKRIRDTYPADGSARSHSVRNNRKRRGSHPHGSRRLRDQAVPG